MAQSVTLSLGSALIAPSAAALTARHFGTVVKSYADGATYLAESPEAGLALDRLGAGSIRFPGGTEGESPLAPGYFDVGSAFDKMALQRAIDFSATKGHLPINFTLVGNIYFDKSDPDPANWSARITDDQRANLSQFFLGSSTGSPGSLERLGFYEYARLHDIPIESIHIGNEFVGEPGYAAAADGSKRWLGYAQVVAVLLPELDALYEQYLTSAANHADLAKPDLVICGGSYTGGPRAIAGNLNGQGLLLDAIDLHLDNANSGNVNYNPTGTLNLTWETYYSSGALTPMGYEARLSAVMDQWRATATNPDLDFRVDAWSYVTNAEGPSLRNAALGMLQLHTFSLLGISSATNYIGYGPDPSALIQNDWGLNIERGITAGGELFAMMSAALHGTAAIRLAGAPSLAIEAGMAHLTRAFVGDGKAVLYVVSRDADTLEIDLDIRSMTATLETFVGGIKVRADGSSGMTQILGNNTVLNPDDPFAIRKVALTRSDLSGDQGHEYVLSANEISQITVWAIGTFGDNVPNSPNDTLTGNGRGDVLHGLTGSDYLSGFAGADILAGGDGNDRLFGDAGNDFLFGGAGADVMLGGGGNDTASYNFATSGVRADLTNGLTTGGEAAGDVFGNIENLVGSGFNDTLRGGSGAASLTGGGGSDAFVFATASEGPLTVTDFVTTSANASRHDVISLDRAGFGNLASLSSAHLVNTPTGLAATTSNRLVFDTTADMLWYDPDGTGARTPFALAFLPGVAALTLSDFLLV